MTDSVKMSISSPELKKAKELFPLQFLTYLSLSGRDRKRARTQLIQRLRQHCHDAAMARLKAQGACCGTCEHYDVHWMIGGNCELERVGGIYMPVRATHICPLFKPKELS